MLPNVFFLFISRTCIGKKVRYIYKTLAPYLGDCFSAKIICQKGGTTVSGYFGDYLFLLYRFTFLIENELSKFEENVISNITLTHSHTMTPFDAPGKQAFRKRCGKRRNYS